MKKTFWATLAMAAALSSSAVEIELLTNGEGTTLEGWENSSNFFGVQRNVETGESWFRANYQPCRLVQTVTLADYGITADAIQAGVTLTASVTAFATERTADVEDRKSVV